MQAQNVTLTYFATRFSGYLVSCTTSLPQSNCSGPCSSTLDVITFLRYSLCIVYETSENFLEYSVVTFEGGFKNVIGIYMLEINRERDCNSHIYIKKEISIVIIIITRYQP